MFKKLFLLAAALILTATSASALDLNIQEFELYAFAGGIDYVILNYEAVDLAAQTTQSQTIQIGATQNLTTSPPTFVTADAGLAYYEASLSAALLAQVNATTPTGSFYADYDVSQIDPPANAAFMNYVTNSSFISTLSGYVTSSGLSSALSSYLATATAASTYFPKPTGTSSQVVLGNGTLGTLPSSPTRTFNYPTRTLASCFQISSGQDAAFNYSVDITAGVISLGGGTASVTSYTNSGCTTGAQTVFNGAVSSVALGGTSSIPLTGIAPAGKWLKIIGTGTGGGTATIDAVQAETLL